MVFFSCDACGQSVKKNQVEKHYTVQCRNCQVLTCIDCQKDFRGEEYKEHIKCVTEDEKYGGKDYKPKPSSRKGEKKQGEWITNIKNYVAATNLSPALASMLTSLTRFENVPRKKAKFENFCKSCIRLKDKKQVEEVWEIFCKANEIQKPSSGDIHKQTSQNAKNNQTVKLETPSSLDATQTVSNPEGGDNQKNKRRKKKKKTQGNATEETSENVNKCTSTVNENISNGEARKNYKMKMKEKKSELEPTSENEEIQKGEQDFSNSEMRDCKKKKKSASEQTSGDVNECTSTENGNIFNSETGKNQKKKNRKIKEKIDVDLKLNHSKAADEDCQNSAEDMEVETQVKKHKKKKAKKEKRDVSEQIEGCTDFVQDIVPGTCDTENMVIDASKKSKKKKRSKKDMAVKGSPDNDSESVPKRKKESEVGISCVLEFDNEQGLENASVKSKKNKKKKYNSL